MNVQSESNKIVSFFLWKPQEHQQVFVDRKMDFKDVKMNHEDQNLTLKYAFKTSKMKHISMKTKAVTDSICLDHLDVIVQEIIVTLPERVSITSNSLVQDTSKKMPTNQICLHVSAFVTMMAIIPLVFQFRSTGNA